MAKKKVTKRSELATQLFEALKAYKKQDQYFVVNRAFKMDFFDVFKDSIFSYRKDLVLCERLYKKSRCTTMPTYDLSEESEEVYQEFLQFLKETEEAKTTDPDIEQLRYEKYKEIESKITANPPKTIEIPIYKFADNSYYNLTPLKKVTDQILKMTCNVISDFVFNYLFAFSFLGEENFNITLFIEDLPELDYIDILAVCNRKEIIE